MKKTLSINIAGIVFHIEEDAYATLDTYLKSIHAYFKNFEGAKDIVDDIEARIAEKFWNIRETEKTEAITQVHVDALIASLGTIADFQEIEEEDAVRPKQFALSCPPSPQRRSHTNPGHLLTAGTCMRMCIAARTHPNFCVVVPSPPSAGFVNA